MKTSQKGQKTLNKTGVNPFM